MQGTILSIAGQGGQGLILGDDGTRYTYTPMGWRDSTVGAAPGMKVDFEIRGAHAVGVYPLPGATPAPPVYANPAATQQPPPVVSSGYPNQPPPSAPHAQPPFMSPGYPNQPPAVGVPQAPPPGTVGEYPNQQWASAPPPAPAPVVATPSSGGLDTGKIISGIAWMFLLSALLSMFLSVIGTLIGGFVGGRKAGSLANAAIAALVSAVAVGGLTLAAVSLIVSILEGLPIIGSIILATPIGDLLKGAAVVVALVHVLPMLLFALLGGATAKK